MREGVSLVHTILYNLQELNEATQISFNTKSKINRSWIGQVSLELYSTFEQVSNQVWLKDVKNLSIKPQNPAMPLLCHNSRDL